MRFFGWVICLIFTVVPVALDGHGRRDVGLSLSGQRVEGQSIDLLLGELDRTIARKEIYIAERRHRIDSLKDIARTQELSGRGMFELNNALISEYEYFRYDSTMLYLRQNLDLATRMGDGEMLTGAKLRLSFALTAGGMYMESIEMLRSINPRDLSRYDLIQYYKSFERVYHHLTIYAGETTYAPRYMALAHSYLDSMQMTVPPGSADANSVELNKFIASGDYDAAKRMVGDNLAKIPFPSHEYAINAAMLAHIYEAAPEGDMHQRYLILSAICDLRAAVRENESMSNLAKVMLDLGDIDRAWLYSLTSMEDANFYNSNLRRIETAKSQPVIEHAYRLKLDQQHRRLRNDAVWLAVLSAVLFFVLAIVLRQIYELRRARRSIEAANSELVTLNGALVESTRIKEEYIGHFMSLCSSYIDKMERYQSTVLNRLNTGKMDELRVMVRSTTLIDHEIKEFYQNFDRVFLKIFPDFVSEFNKLLREEERITVPMGEMLTTELRIFALVRLGIHDSSQIARFLRYSANTVYTYRTKVKNKAIDRANFESDLSKINLY